MEKKIVQIDESRNMVQVTIADSRWYIKPQPDSEGIPQVVAVPSSSWIASYYYTSPYLVKWIADKGLDEAEVIKKAAGEKGSKVHRAIDLWLKGEEIRIDTKIEYEGKQEELTPEENECFLSFINFYKEVKPEIIAQEYVVWGNGYAGTVDLKCKINGELGILDFKSSQSIYRTHELQIASYKHADEQSNDIHHLWVLQLGYRRNKAKWKLTEIEDKFHLFLNAMDTWKEETKGQVPKYIEYPTTYPTKADLDSQPSLDLEVDNNEEINAELAVSSSVKSNAKKPRNTKTS